MSLEKYSLKLAREQSRSLDDLIRDLLGDKDGNVTLKNITLGTMIRLHIERGIIKMRVWLANWIGGDHLHDDCGDSMY